MSMRYKGGVISATPPTVTISSATGLWTMQDQMRYQAAGTWPPSVTPDPYFEYVTMLLHGDGTNGAQNNTFLDSSTNAFSITRNGNTTQGAFSPFSRSNGYWSNYFDGSGDYLSYASNAAFQFGTGDFTIEFWWNPSTLASTQTILYNTDNASVIGTGHYGVVYNTSLGLRLYINGGATAINQGSTTGWTVGTWYHVAIVRNGNTVTIYRDGTSIASGSVTGVTIGAATTSYFGGEPLDPLYCTGYFSNLRIVKGTAVYTSAFTPPTSPLTAITNTSLLTCQSNRFIDNSTNAFTITRNGDTSIQVFSPFNPTTAYSTTANGGSGYFDGTGDMLATPSITIGTSAFCFECWWYPTAVQGAAAGIFVANTQSGLQLSYYDTSGSGGLGIAQKGVAWQLFNNDGVKPIVNQWNHIAFVRSGTGTNQTSIFLNGTRIANGTVAYNYVASTYEVSTTQAGGTTLQGYMGGARFTLGSSPYDATQTTITIPTAPLTAITNTSLLLNFTNGGIFDNAAMNNLETVGNAQISTAQSKFGGGSMYFDGTGDYLFTPQPISNALGTGDFTVEMWIYVNSHKSYSSFFVNQSVDNASDGVTWLMAGTGQQQIYISSFVYTSTGSVPTGQWVHLAMARSGSTVKFFVNGVADATTWTTSMNFSSSRLTIGAPSWNGAQSLNGYIDDLRITKGFARYTANFTPPTLAFPNF